MEGFVCSVFVAPYSTRDDHENMLLERGNGDVSLSCSGGAIMPIFGPSEHAVSSLKYSGQAFVVSLCCRNRARDLELFTQRNSMRFPDGDVNCTP